MRKRCWFGWTEQTLCIYFFIYSIAAPCCGIPDLIKPSNGIICNRFDSVSIAEGILEALITSYDSVLISLYIVREFDWESIVGQYIKLYKNILYTKGK